MIELMYLSLDLVVDHFLTSCAVEILKGIINLQPCILCSSTRNNHLGCATAASGVPGNFSPSSNEKIILTHLKLTTLSQVDLSLLRGHLYVLKLYPKIDMM